MYCQVTPPTRNTFQALTGLDSFTAYDISVFASNKLGNKSSTWIQFTTLGNLRDLKCYILYLLLV